MQDRNHLNKLFQSKPITQHSLNVVIASCCFLKVSMPQVLNAVLLINLTCYFIIGLS